MMNTNITSLDIPDGVTEVTVQFCASLTSVTIPGSVKEINAFLGCTSLTSLTIENGVEKITAYAFKDCPLTRVELPQSVTEVYVSSFRNSSELSVYMYRSTRLINEYPSLPVYTNFYRYR